MNPTPIVVSAVVFSDHDGRLLTVRKRGTRAYMLPGGKPEPGENARQAAVREVREELGIDGEADALHPMGTFTTAAANEPDHQVVATVFTHEPVTVGAPAAEIEHLRWLDPTLEPLPDVLAPLLTEAVIPRLHSETPSREV